MMRRQIQHQRSDMTIAFKNESHKGTARQGKALFVVLRPYMSGALHDFALRTL